MKKNNTALIFLIFSVLILAIAFIYLSKDKEKKKEISPPSAPSEIKKVPNKKFIRLPMLKDKALEKFVNDTFEIEEIRAIRGWIILIQKELKEGKGGWHKQEGNSSANLVFGAIQHAKKNNSYNYSMPMVRVAMKKQFPELNHRGDKTLE